MPPAVEQRTTALEKANKIRLIRASLKRNVAAMTRQSAFETVAEAIEVNPEVLRTMDLLELLGAIPHVGRQTAMRFLRRCQIPASAKVGTLSVRQRIELAALLRWSA